MANVFKYFSNSIRKNSKGIILIIISALFTSVGQLFWKLSAGSDLKYVFLGFVCYGLGAVIMIIAFRFGSLSVLHPFMSVGYIFALILGRLQLKERVSPIECIAVAIIILGVTLIGGGDD